MKIDFHTHIFPDKIAKRAIEKLQSSEKIPVYTEGTATSLLESSKEAGVIINVVLPVVTKPGQASLINNEAVKGLEEFNIWLKANESKRSSPVLYYFGGIHPDNEDYKKQIDTLSLNGVRGIKLHPVFQETYFDDIRYMRILDYIFEKGMYVNVHAGSDVSKPNAQYAFENHLIPVLKEFRSENDKIILAHFGGWNRFESVKEMLFEYKPLVDTSFSLYEKELKAIAFKPLTKEAFRSYLSILGPERILFGTDSPWTDQKESLKLLKNACRDEAIFNKITYENAKRILMQ